MVVPRGQLEAATASASMFIKVAVPLKWRTIQLLQGCELGRMAAGPAGIVTVTRPPPVLFSVIEDILFPFLNLA